MNLPGKGIFIWKAKHCVDGSISAIVAACQLMGLKWVALKIGDGASIRYATFPETMAEAVKAFHAAGMQVWGWQYVYGGVYFDRFKIARLGGYSPETEAVFAKAQVKGLGLDGYIIDAEREYKVFSPMSRANRFMTNLQGIGVPVALASYRFPELHPELPWTTFLEGCDLHMPQVYWGPGKETSDLDTSVRQLKALRVLPIAPIGRAYIGDGFGSPGPNGAALGRFLERAEEIGCPGVSFWALDYLYLHAGGQERQEAIGAYLWEDAGPELPVEVGPDAIGRVRVTAGALNVRSMPGANGLDLGDLTRGSEWFVFRVTDDWGMIGSGAWVRLGRGYAEWVARYEGG